MTDKMSVACENNYLVKYSNANVKPYYNIN